MKRSYRHDKKIKGDLKKKTCRHIDNCKSESGDLTASFGFFTKISRSSEPGQEIWRARRITGGTWVIRQGTNFSPVSAHLLWRTNYFQLFATE